MILVVILVLFLVMVMAAPRPPRNAIFGIVYAKGDTKTAFARKESEAGIRGPGFGAGVGYEAALVGRLAQFLGLLEMAFLFFFGRIGQQVGAQFGRHGEAGDLEVVGLAPRTVGVEDEAAVAQTRIERAAEFTQVSGGIRTGQDIHVDRFARQTQRNSLVDDIDRAADRLAAEQQHGGAAQNLDALGGESIDRNGVVIRGIRRVDRTDAVDQHLDAFAREPAQDRARGAGREAACRDAGLAVEDFADLAIEIALQFLALDHVGPCEQIEVADPLRTDDDPPLIVDAAIVKIVGQRGVGRGFGSVVLRSILRMDVIAGSECGERHGGTDQAERSSHTIQHIAAH